MSDDHGFGIILIIFQVRRTVTSANFIAYGRRRIEWAVKECETPVGRVISGMEHAAKFYIVTAKMPPWAMDRCKVKFTGARLIDAISADGFV
jgi:hypothetical protein